MSAFDDEESFEHTLLVVREVSVYKIPPRSTSGGHKCGEWLQSVKIWIGRLRVVSCGERSKIRLEDPNSGELFAACFMLPGQRENSVETVLDSSRYFVLKIEDGRGNHAFIGLGFNERNEAFDFNVALSDYEKYVKRESEKEAGGGEESDESSHIDIHPAVNLKLKTTKLVKSTDSFQRPINCLCHNHLHSCSACDSLGATHFDESLYKILLKPEIKYIDAHTGSEIFKHCDVYLLDDGFSTVDAHTGSEIFKECVRGGALREEMIVLVTH